MESNNSNQIKQTYFEYAKSKGFKYHNSDSIVAPSDSRLLFNISGGVRYQDELLQKKEVTEKKVASIQQCLRTDNIDNIGISGRHHLFFEMLGHFMFYDCKEIQCKEEFISFAYNYLINIVGLDKNRIYATIHPNDIVSYNIWTKLKNSNLIFSQKNIFVSPYTDKSALRTEILWQRDDNEKSLMELWNLIFTQFDSKQVFQQPSEFIGADSGASLERIVSAYENKTNNYENSMWSCFVHDIKLLNRDVTDEQSRKIADFTNTTARLINEGVVPGNKTQSYMLRKMLRLLFEMCDESELDLEQILNSYILYVSLSMPKEKITKVILEEKVRYFTAITNGLKLARKEIIKKGIENIEPTYFKSTLGLPEKYVREILIEHNSPQLIKKM